MSTIQPHSTIVDDLIARVRKIEAANPQVAVFDAKTLPPRDFEIATPEERAWVNACIAIMNEHMRRERAATDARLASMTLHRALSPRIAKT